MARDHARLRCAIWTDDDFLERTGDAQRLYMLLMSQQDITYAGVLPYRPRRWARLAKDSNLTKIRRSLGELGDHGFIALDHDTEETAVRTFIHHDGVLKVPNISRAMVKAYRHILSDHLRDVVLNEVARLWENRPEGDGAKGWPIVMAPIRDGGMREDVEAALQRGDR